MLIKKSKQLKLGTVIKFTGPCVEDVNKRKKHDVIVKEIYPHFIIGEIIEYDNIDDFSPHICMTNIELVMQGIYKPNDVEGNIFGATYNKEEEEKNKIEETRLLMDWLKEHNKDDIKEILQMGERIRTYNRSNI